MTKKRNNQRGLADGEETVKREKFSYTEMKIAATHENPALRKKTFIDYFARFQEFPSYLFDNDSHIDPRLQRTIDDLVADPDTSKAIRAGIEALLRRLPS